MSTFGGLDYFIFVMVTGLCVCAGATHTYFTNCRQMSAVHSKTASGGKAKKKVSQHLISDGGGSEGLSTEEDEARPPGNMLIANTFLQKTQMSFVPILNTKVGIVC